MRRVVPFSTRGIRRTAFRAASSALCFLLPYAVLSATDIPEPRIGGDGSRSTSYSGFTDSNLPIVVIDTRGEPIRYDIKIDADMGIIDNGPGRRNAVKDPFNDYHGPVGIEVRGQSSAGWPKKQWGFETRNPDGSNRNVSLLGLPRENDWILNAPFIDRSMMRNVLIFRLSREMGRYASRSRFCEVILNGEYRGVYVLLEKIKRDSRRVPISRLVPGDDQGDAVTGGYILKVDKPGNHYFQSRYPPYPGSRYPVRYQYHCPRDRDITDAQKTYIRNWMYAFEDMMAGPAFADPDDGYARYIDTGSFVDHLILNELAKNVDGFRLSAFMYKTRDSRGGRLHAGPIWDFNLAFGNANYYDAHSAEGWILIHFLTSGDSSLPPFWWYRLIDDPAFLRRIYERWTALRRDVLDVRRIHGLIDAMADTLTEAVGRNFEIWPGPGQPGTGFWPVPPVFYTFTTYADEIGFLKTWIADRIAWMDADLAGLARVGHSRTNPKPDAFLLHPNHPNPFNGRTRIRFELGREAEIRLVVFDAAGRHVHTLVEGLQAPGIREVFWDGASDSGHQVPCGMYVARLSDGKTTHTVKMIYLR